MWKNNVTKNPFENGLYQPLVKLGHGLWNCFTISITHNITNIYSKLVGHGLWNIIAHYPAGWWFGTFFIFPYIGNNHPNWLIFFQRGSNHQPDGITMVKKKVLVYVPLPVRVPARGRLAAILWVNPIGGWFKTCHGKRSATSSSKKSSFIFFFRSTLEIDWQNQLEVFLFWRLVYAVYHTGGSE